MSVIPWRWNSRRGRILRVKNLSLFPYYAILAGFYSLNGRSIHCIVRDKTSEHATKLISNIVSGVKISVVPFGALSAPRLKCCVIRENTRLIPACTCQKQAILPPHPWLCNTEFSASISTLVLVSKLILIVLFSTTLQYIAPFEWHTIDATLKRSIEDALLCTKTHTLVLGDAGNRITTKFVVKLLF